jgi:hypothetical protein
MKTRAKSWLISTSSAFSVALLAFSFSVGDSHAVRAGDPEIVSYPGQETVVVPVKDLQVLEQRVRYLEESVADLTESWQHIDTHRLCVSDDAGATETCITKPQLDALLVSQAAVAQASAPEAVVAEAKTLPAEEPVAVAATEDKSEPTPGTSVTEVSQKDPEPELPTVAVAATEDKSEPTPGTAATEVSQKDPEPELPTASVASTENKSQPTSSPAAIEDSQKDPGTEPVAVAATEDKPEPTSGSAAIEDSQKDPGAEPVAVAATEDKPEPTPSPDATQVLQKDAGTELTTGSLATIEHAAEASPAPQIEPLPQGDLP